jgi:hypothetical protein
MLFSVSVAFLVILFSASYGNCKKKKALVETENAVSD